MNSSPVLSMTSFPGELCHCARWSWMQWADTWFLRERHCFCAMFEYVYKPRDASVFDYLCLWHLKVIYKDRSPQTAFEAPTLLNLSSLVLTRSNREILRLVLKYPYLESYWGSWRGDSWRGDSSSDRWPVSSACSPVSLHRTLSIKGLYTLFNCSAVALLNLLAIIKI